jgi:SAM-dependent methyltransferase
MLGTSNITALNEWYQKSLGATLLKTELTGLASVLPQIFGYYIMQIGGPTNNNEILSASHIHNHIIINPDTITTINDDLAVQCQLDDLPFLPESIDAVLLFHTLEFTKKPKSILKEIYTTLMPNGYAVILGFNPYSLWGVAPIWKRSKEIPWAGNWISPGHMRQWLAKIGFDIGDYKTFYFRPPSDSTNNWFFLEALGQIFWPYWGASYMFVAQKTVTGLTPIKPLSFVKKYFRVPKALPKPTSRTQCNKNQHM